MTKPSPRYLSCAETAALIRAALKEAFGAVKFSVRSKTYSGGASINVGWIDGPTSTEVDAVARRFAGATFDGMEDLKHYHLHSLGGEPVHFGADYVFTSRSLSAGFLQRVVDDVLTTWRLPDGFDPASVVVTPHSRQKGYTIEAFVRAPRLRMPNSTETIGDLIQRKAYETSADFYLDDSPTAALVHHIRTI